LGSREKNLAKQPQGKGGRRKTIRTNGQTKGKRGGFVSYREQKKSQKKKLREGKKKDEREGRVQQKKRRHLAVRRRGEKKFEMRGAETRGKGGTESST